MSGKQKASWFAGGFFSALGLFVIAVLVYGVFADTRYVPVVPTQFKLPETAAYVEQNANVDLVVEQIGAVYYYISVTGDCDGVATAKLTKANRDMTIADIQNAEAALCD